MADDGTYRLRHLDPGQYVLHFVPGPGNRLEPLYWEKARTFSRADPLPVTGGRTRTKVNVELRSG